MQSLTTTSWWQPQSLEREQCIQFQLGPLILFLQRKAGEWWLCFEHSSEEPPLQASLPSETSWPEQVSPERFIFSTEPSTVLLTPRLLDRSVVVKTRQPVYLPVGEEITFYISSPVKLSVELKKPQVYLKHLYTERLSETWFGPNTQFGELCYADKTHARHSKDELFIRAHRAITPVTVKNQANQMMSISKLSLPLPYLALYGHTDGSLWTDGIVIEHQDNSDLSKLHIQKHQEDGAKNSTRLASAQQQFGRHGLFRALSGLLNQTERG